jgi:hypothetical protein
MFTGKQWNSWSVQRKLELVGTYFGVASIVIAFVLNIFLHRKTKKTSTTYRDSEWLLVGKFDNIKKKRHAKKSTNRHCLTVDLRHAAI